MTRFNSVLDCGDFVAWLKNNPVHSDFHYVPRQLIDGQYVVLRYIKLLKSDETLELIFDQVL